MSKKSQFKVFEDIIPKEIKPLIKKKLYERDILKEFKHMLKGSMALHIKPLYINNNCIVIAVDNPLWGNELINHKSFYLKRLQQQYKSASLHDFIIKFIPHYFTGEKTIEVNLSKEDQDFVENCTKEISDESLRSKMEKLISTLLINKKK